MASTAFKGKQPDSGPAGWEMGEYLTDGLRLFCIVSVDGDAIYLENVRSEALERWSARQLRAMREVKPWPVPK